MTDAATSFILQTVPLGSQWPTVDPFLFCAHHLDNYPAGRADMSPNASLVGRDIGADFASRGGWNMYHGSTVAGFPQHPHRGFETITYVRSGLIDHSDSMGATARFGPGDTQWLTAGGGIVHCEMFPLVHTDRPNPLELFQIWLNLPRADKMVEPYFTMRWGEDLIRVPLADGRGELALIVGNYGDYRSPAPPPNSWANNDQAEVAIWHLGLEPGASTVLPAAVSPDCVRILYFFEGSTLRVGDDEVASSTGVVLRCDVPVVIQATDQPAQCLVMQGVPIGEPVVKHGPFVMNDREGIEQTFRDYDATGFGGWPWPSDGPVHPAASQRFAIHPNGRWETPSADTVAATIDLVTAPAAGG